MADITDVQVVRFANERTRVLADKLEALYFELSAYRSDYAGQGISAKITAAGASGTIADGSDVDGRQRITGVSIQNLAAGLTQLQTAWDTTLVAGVGATLKSMLDTVQVNGTPR